MSNDEFAVLGAWEDCPRRNPAADVTAVQLDNRQAFLLTRLDGVASISDICAISGMTERESLEVLSGLHGQGLILLQQAKGRRTLIDLGGPVVAEPLTSDPNDEDDPDGPAILIDEPKPGDPPAIEEVAPALQQVDSLPDFNGVDPEDSGWLMQRREVGYIPGMPYKRPGEGRFGRFVFDRRQLLHRCELTIAQRREVLFLDGMAGKLDHFEYFDFEPTADRTLWRKAYFKLSKRFHPDQFFRRNTGIFGPIMERIYRYVTKIHDAFGSDAELRTRYARAVLARDAAYRDALEEARYRRERAKRDIAEKKEAAKRALQQRHAAKRKAALRQRLDGTRRQRRAAHNPAAERIARAEQFYTQGMQQYQEEKFLEAATSLQLAMTYDPKNESYAQAWEKVSKKAAAIRAEQLWKMGYMQESVARMDEAIDSYMQAVEAHPRPDYCIHTAQMMLTMDRDLHKAAELARIASDADPQNVEYLLTLGRIYEQVRLLKKAAGVLEKAQKLAPKDDRVKKAIKALKRL